MSTFTYTAVSKEGKTESGTIDAASYVVAGHLLKEQGMMPVNISEKTTSNLLGFFSGLTNVPLKEKIAFISNLNLLLKAGVAAPRALRIISKQTTNRKFRTILETMATNVEAGKSLHDAMADYPKVFSHIFLSMIEVGEMSGNLEKSLEYLAIQLQREADLKSKTKGAMIYPGVIVSAMVIVGLVLSIFVLPKLTATFKDFDTQLPFATRLVVGFTDFMSNNSILVISVFVVGVGLAIVLARTPAGKRAFAGFLLRMPLISPVVKKINIARFSRILGSLMKSGISVVQGLKVTGDAMGNVYYEEVIARTADNVKLGKQLTESLAMNEKLFPPIVTQMLAIGEETGNLETILDQLAEHYEAEIDETMKNLSSIIEPLLLLVIGAVVGFLAMALIMPIYNISQSIT